MLKKFQYLPNNWDWVSKSSELMTMSQKGLNSDIWYMFHTVPEEFIATLVMVAQLKNMKISKDHADPDVAGKSLWDMYHVMEEADPDTGEIIYEVKWGKKDSQGNLVNVIRGVRNVSRDPDNEDLMEVGELLPEEISRMFMVYERLHGGYRKEERTLIEYYAFGQLMMQFKRFMPAILRNAMQSGGKYHSMGYLKPTGEIRDDQEVVEWVSRVSEGR